MTDREIFGLMAALEAGEIDTAEWMVALHEGGVSPARLRTVLGKPPEPWPVRAGWLALSIGLAVLIGILAIYWAVS